MPEALTRAHTKGRCPQWGFRATRSHGRNRAELCAARIEVLRFGTSRSQIRNRRTRIDRLKRTHPARPHRGETSDNEIEPRTHTDFDGARGTCALEGVPRITRAGRLSDAPCAADYGRTARERNRSTIRAGFFPVLFAASCVAAPRTAGLHTDPCIPCNPRPDESAAGEDAVKAERIRGAGGSAARATAATAPPACCAQRRQRSQR